MSGIPVITISRQYGAGGREIADLYLEGLTFTNIAERLGKNAQTVKVQLRRIKEKCGVKHCRDIIRVLRLKNY